MKLVTPEVSGGDRDGRASLSCSPSVLCPVFYSLFFVVGQEGEMKVRQEEATV